MRPWRRAERGTPRHYVKPRRCAARRGAASALIFSVRARTCVCASGAAVHSARARARAPITFIHLEARRSLRFFLPFFVPFRVHFHYRAIQLRRAARVAEIGDGNDRREGDDPREASRFRHRVAGARAMGNDYFLLSECRKRPLPGIAPF